MPSLAIHAWAELAKPNQQWITWEKITKPCNHRHHPACPQTMEAGISSQGLSPTQPNGLTTFWPNHTSRRLMEAPPSTFSSRALLRFGGLDAYVPQVKPGFRVEG